jgi:hypothetical protein
MPPPIPPMPPPMNWAYTAGAANPAHRIGSQNLILFFITRLTFEQTSLSSRFPQAFCQFFLSFYGQNCRCLNRFSTPFNTYAAAIVPF